MPFRDERCARFTDPFLQIRFSALTMNIARSVASQIFTVRFHAGVAATHVVVVARTRSMISHEWPPLSKAAAAALSHAMKHAAMA
jgi:hypothetical protein